MRPLIPLIFYCLGSVCFLVGSAVSVWQILHPPQQADSQELLIPKPIKQVLMIIPAKYHIH
jgi:hypothetical protein